MEKQTYSQVRQEFKDGMDYCLKKGLVKPEELKEAQTSKEKMRAFTIKVLALYRRAKELGKA